MHVRNIQTRQEMACDVGSASRSIAGAVVDSVCFTFDQELYATRQVIRITWRSEFVVDNEDLPRPVSDLPDHVA